MSLYAKYNFVNIIFVLSADFQLNVNGSWLLLRPVLINVWAMIWCHWMLILAIAAYHSDTPANQPSGRCMAIAN